MGIAEASSHTFIMQLLINEFGEIDDVLIENKEVAESVQILLRTSFKTAKFKPGQINKRLVKSRLDIEVKLDEIIPE